MMSHTMATIVRQLTCLRFVYGIFCYGEFGGSVSFRSPLDTTMRWFFENLDTFSEYQVLEAHDRIMCARKIKTCEYMLPRETTATEG